MSKTPNMSKEIEVLILGGGVAGSVAATFLAKNGVKVAMVDRAGGATMQSSGAVDVAQAHAHFERNIGYMEAASFIAKEYIYHPYSKIGIDSLPALREALLLLQELVHDVALVGREDGQNMHLATQLGTLKQSAMAQHNQSFDLNSLTDGDSLLIMGFSGLPSFDARAVARMLKWSLRNAMQKDIQVSAVELDFSSPSGAWRSAMEMALYVDEEDHSTQLESAIRRGVENGELKFKCCLMPPVAGRKMYQKIWQSVNEKQSVPIYELLAIPHSIAGLRLHDAMKKGIEHQGIERIIGEAISAERSNGKISKVLISTNEAVIEMAPAQVIVATGRFFSGGFEREGMRREKIFGLPLWHRGKLIEQAHVSTLSTNDSSSEQAIFCSGLNVDDKMRPLDPMMELFALNLFAAGSSIGGYDTSGKDSGLGLAAYSGYMSAFHTMKNTFRE